MKHCFTVVFLVALAAVPLHGFFGGMMGGGSGGEGMGGLGGMIGGMGGLGGMMGGKGGLGGMMSSFMPNKGGGEGALGKMTLGDLIGNMKGGSGGSFTKMIPPMVLNSAASQWIPEQYQQKILKGLNKSKSNKEKNEATTTMIPMSPPTTNEFFPFEYL